MSDLTPEELQAYRERFVEPLLKSQPVPPPVGEGKTPQPQQGTVGRP